MDSDSSTSSDDVIICDANGDIILDRKEEGAERGGDGYSDDTDNDAWNRKMAKEMEDEFYEQRQSPDLGEPHYLMSVIWLVDNAVEIC